MRDILKSYVEKIKDFPTLPANAYDILNLATDPLLSVEKLKRIVETDPAISAKILGVANSAFFGYPVGTTKLDDAIVRIGFDSVKSIAVGIAVLSFLDNGNQTADYKRIFNHSVTVGLTSRFISQNLKLSIADDILIDGLLHDLGFLVLQNFFPTIYEKVLSSLQETTSLLKAEMEMLRNTHADVGFWLAEQWNLPDTISDTNLYHHSPSLARRNEKRLAVIHVADYIVSNSIMSPIGRNPNYHLDYSSFDILAISSREMEEMEALIGNIPLSDEIFNMRHEPQRTAKNLY